MTRLQAKVLLIEYFKERIQKNEFENIQKTFPRQWAQDVRHIPQPDLDQFDKLIPEILNEWNVNNILYFGKYGENIGCTCVYIQLTEHGKKFFTTNDAITYDPNLYLDSIRSIVRLSKAVTTYIKEAIETYNKNQLRSSAVMLGLASETIILDLTEAFKSSLNKPAESNQIQQSIDNDNITTLWNNVWSLIETKHIIRRAVLGKALWQDSDYHLNLVRNFIRLSRNAAGHPSDNEITNIKVLTLLQIFPDYAKKILAFERFFNANPHRF